MFSINKKTEEREHKQLLQLTNGGERDEEKETSNTDSMTQGQTMRVHAAAFFVNFVLWIFMVSVVFLRKDNMRHFTYPMTKRFGINTNYTRIDEVFTGWNGSRLGQAMLSPENRFPFNAENRVILRDDIFMMAGCMPVASAGGSHTWGPQAVSPMCDCLDSMLSAKIMAYIGKNVTRLPELETMNIEAATMAAKTSKEVKDALGVLKWDRCHSVARSTQVEELMGTKDFLSTNIVYTTLVWCFVAVLGSLYVTGTHEHQTWKGINLPWAAFIGVVMASTTTPAFFIAGASWGCGIISFIISSLVLTVVVTMMVMGNPDDANHHVVRSITLTSICYTIGAWASWAILCSVTQQRDYLFALSTGFMVMVIGMVSFSSRYAYHVVVKFSDDKDAKLDVQYSAYKTFFSNAWYCNICIVVSLLATPGTFFMAGVFSNTNRVALASTIIMFSYPIIQKVHLAPPKGSRKDMEATTVDSDTTLYVATDMVARFLMVAAVGMDVLTGGTVDRV